MRRKITMLAACLLALVMLSGTALAAGLPFTDVKTGDWYCEYVQYTYENKLFAGTSATTFSPNVNMTRGMFVTVLRRQSASLGRDVSAGANTAFTDLGGQSEEFREAIIWAAENKIVNGVSDTRFAPKDNVTREQMCAIIVRYMRDYLKLDLSAYAGSASFADSAQISAYAKEAVAMAQSLGIVNGMQRGSSFVFDPAGSATRAAVAKVLTTESRAVDSLMQGQPPAPVDPGNNGGNGGNNGGNGGGTTKPVTPAHTDEEIAKEQEVVALLRSMVAKYPAVAREDATAVAAMDQLIQTLKDALAAHDGGAFLDRAYVDAHFAAQVAQFEQASRAMTKAQKTAMTDMASGLGKLQDLLMIFDYFGYDYTVFL